MKRLRLLVTGNPGVGKHTVAKLVAEKLGAGIIDINKVATEGAAISGSTDKGLDIDLGRLKRLINKEVVSKKHAVVVGHLAPYVVRRNDITMVAVLRRSPYALEKTLQGRGYSHSKVQENVASEILGVSMYDAVKSFGRRKVVEFDTTTKRPAQTAKEVVQALENKRPKNRPRVDWLSLVSENDDIRRFFEY